MQAIDSSHPIGVLYTLLMHYGYADSPSAFAKLLRINKGNVAAYLAPRDSPTRIIPRIDTLHAWAWGVSQTTELKIQILLVGSDLFWHCTGLTSSGTAINGDKWATSHSSDFQPLKAWRDVGSE